MNNQNLKFWRNRRRITSLVIAMLFLITAAPAYAKYKPRDRKPASGYSRGGGSRGGNIPLTLLAPQRFIGKTASLRPMLAWYTSSTKNVRFRLYEFESATKVKQIGESKEISTVVGINKLKLPTDYPELTVGKTYLWQIAIDSPSGVMVKRAEFTVIDSQSLAKNKITSIRESVNYYAENELWYEALEEALKAESDGKLGEAGSKLVQELAQFEMPTGSENSNGIIERRIKNLQKISRDL